MFKFLNMDWIDYLFNYLSLKLYEKGQEKHRKLRDAEKIKL